MTGRNARRGAPARLRSPGEDADQAEGLGQAIRRNLRDPRRLPATKGADGGAQGHLAPGVLRQAPGSKVPMTRMRVGTPPLRL